MAFKPAGLFSDDERAQIINFWNAPSRYRCEFPPSSQTKGIWQVRLTPEGSIWLLKYQAAIGSAGAPPTEDAANTSSSTWRMWVQSKVAYDRYTAGQFVKAANAGIINQPDASSTPPSRNRRRRVESAVQDNSAITGTVSPTSSMPSAPGPIPDSLFLRVGNPPSFAEAVAPMQHTISFEDGDIYSYIDNTLITPTYAYYRFKKGVATPGTSLTETERSDLFNSAGLNETEQRVMLAVSKLEGSMDAINTYDTGFVSIGFIQFITGEDGRHSLCDVLAREKQDRPDDFFRDFHRYGIDLTPDGIIAVIDPTTGAELVGKDAVYKLIEDKRLIAVFQKAGRKSHSFRVAQIQVAKTDYWPEDDKVEVKLNGKVYSGIVSDIVRSEAGLATLFDRKVNRGSVRPLADVAARTMSKYHLSSLSNLQAYEREIISAMKYRTDFLKDPSLRQPQ